MVRWVEVMNSSWRAQDGSRGRRRKNTPCLRPPIGDGRGSTGRAEFVLPDHEGFARESPLALPGPSLSIGSIRGTVARSDDIEFGAFATSEIKREKNWQEFESEG